MTFADSANLISDAAFRGRVKVSCLSYAGAILANPTQFAGAVNARLRWAQSTFTNPDATASQVAPPVVMNVNVQQAGPDIEDDALLASVSYVVEQML